MEMIKHKKKSDKPQNIVSTIHGVKEVGVGESGGGAVREIQANWFHHHHPHSTRTLQLKYYSETKLVN